MSAEERRDSIKDQIMRYLNGKQSILTERIKSNYLELHNTIQALKELTYKGKDDNEKFQLTIELMKLESAFVVDVVGKKFCTKYNKRPIGIIHDAIVCPEHVGNEIAQFIRDEWLNRFGLPCFLKIKDFPTIVKTK
jgi:hypothetical protein